MLSCLLSVASNYGLHSIHALVFKLEISFSQISHYLAWVSIYQVYVVQQREGYIKRVLTCSAIQPHYSLKDSVRWL